MKRIDLFCSSPASTAICVSMDQRSMVRHNNRSIDRHRRNPLRSIGTTPCSSLPPINPKPYHQSGRKSSSKPSELISPSGSSRYLLPNTSLFDMLSNFDPVSALVPFEPTSRSKSVKPSNLSDVKPSSTTSSNQVVVLRVSLHCKGCEGKVRKHISRMEGVTSFSIDFAMKKVTVIGDVTPLGVLASVSRVKNAQLWPSSRVGGGLDLLK